MIASVKISLKNCYTKCLIKYFFSFLGLDGWEKRLIISDRAHIGRRAFVFITAF